MKRLLSVVLGLLFAVSAFAEYNGHVIHFSIQLKSGATKMGYAYLNDISYQAEDMDYQSFLEKNFDLLLKYHSPEGKLHYAYYLDRLRYDIHEGGGKRSAYYLLNSSPIELSSIQSLKIHEMLSQSYAMGFYSSHQLSDTLWMNTPVQEYLSVGGTFCSYDIYIHEHTAETEAWVEALKAHSLAQDKMFAKLNEDIEQSYDEERAEAEAALAAYEEGLDDEMAAVLADCCAAKVVVISFCTC